MTLSASIEYGRLPICVDLVDLAVSLLDKEIDKIEFSFSCRVIQSSLVEIIRLISANAHLSKNARHSYSLIVTPDQCSRKHRGLLIVGFIKELSHIIAMRLMLLHDLINVSLFDKIQKSFHKLL